MTGFTVSIEFTRGANDKITIDMPGVAVGANLPVAGSASGNIGNVPAAVDNALHKQGVFLRTASHAVTGDNPLQTDIDCLVRSVHITVQDDIPVYP